MILLLLCRWHGFAQPAEHLLLTRVSEENGLSDNNVNCVLKDSQGFVWIGTDDGLNRIDGSSMTIWKSKKGDSTALPSNNITVLTEGETGEIWIGTTEGVCCYHRKENRFYNYGLAQSPYGGATNIITNIITDKNNIWIGTDGGLINLQPATGRQELLLTGNLEPKQRRKACNQITRMVMDNKHMLWFGTMEGLWSYSITNQLFKKEISVINDKQYDPLNLSIANAGDTMWVGTWNKGLKILDKKKGTVKSAGSDGNKITSITLTLSSSASPLLWLNGAFRKFNTDTGKFSQNPAWVTEPNLYVNTVYVAPDNWLWFCTNAGLYICNPGRQSFQNTIFKNDITSQSIVFASAGNKLLVGGSNNNILKSYTGSFTAEKDFHNLVFKNKPSEKTADALDLIIENPQSWWLATSNGIAHLNPQAGSSCWFVHKEGDSTSLPRNFVSKLYIDKQHNLWIFPWREGVWQMDRTTGKCKRMIDGLNDVGGSKKKLVIADAAEDDQGNLWLADMDEGIIYYNRASGVFTKPFASVIGQAPQTLRIYKKSSFFYSIANSVLIKWETPQHCTRILFPAEMNKKIYDFSPDKKDGWWFSTQNGLIYFNEQRNQFKRFTIADGLYSNELSANLFCLPDGNMFIGASDFITRFLPEKLIQPVAGFTKPVLTGLLINGSHYEVQDGTTIQLAYNENNILLNWALPDYNNPFKNNYFCKLKGLDSAWRYVGFTGEVQYANLSPGEYTVLLKAANANGDVATQNLELHIVVHPPFWKKIWFIIGCLLSGSSILYYVISRRIKLIKTEAAVQRQMSELEMKALRAQMHPHFIFNCLNSIQECIVMNNTEAAYEYLGKFSKMVRRILENSGKLYVPLQEEIELLQWYVQLEQLRFKEPVEFSIDIDPMIDTADINLPAMILQPYVENALWHGLATKKGRKKLQVQFTQTDNNIECTIEDNGIGRQASTIPKQNKSMGMMITRERLQLFNRQAKVETIDLFNENNKAIGTRIVIYLPTE